MMFRELPDDGTTNDGDDDDVGELEDTELSRPWTATKRLEDNSDTSHHGNQYLLCSHTPLNPWLRPVARMILAMSGTLLMENVRQIDWSY